MSSKLEMQLRMDLILAGFKPPEQEHKFHPSRNWRFDFAYPTRKIAIEAEGGVWSAGRHTRGGGYTSDCEKYNEATAMGWRIFRVTSRKMGKQLPRLIKALLEEDEKHEAVLSRTGRKAGEKTAG